MYPIPQIRFAAVPFKTVKKHVREAATRRKATRLQARRNYVHLNGTQAEKVRLGAGEILAEYPENIPYYLRAISTSPDTHPARKIAVKDYPQVEIFLIPVYLWDDQAKCYAKRPSHRTVYVVNNQTYGIERVKRVRKTKTKSP